MSKHGGIAKDSVWVQGMLLLDVVNIGINIGGFGYSG